MDEPGPEWGGGQQEVSKSSPAHSSETLGCCRSPWCCVQRAGTECQGLCERESSSCPPSIEVQELDMRLLKWGLGLLLAVFLFCVFPTCMASISSNH
jgi:hypothetical protein